MLKGIDGAQVQASALVLVEAGNGELAAQILPHMFEHPLNRLVGGMRRSGSALRPAGGGPLGESEKSFKTWLASRSRHQSR
jgi:hypothetical protein